MSITIDVPRQWLLNANQRLHWAEKGKRTSWLRKAASVHAKHLYWERLHADLPVPYPGKVRCEVTIDWSPLARRRDAMNLSPTFKACLDGVVDAGVLQDDDDKHLQGPDPRVSDQLCDKTYACTLTFRFTEVEA